MDLSALKTFIRWRASQVPSAWWTFPGRWAGANYLENSRWQVSPYASLIRQRLDFDLLDPEPAGNVTP